MQPGLWCDNCWEESQYERAVIRGRMMAGKAAKVAGGGYGGGRPAYGFKADRGALVPNPDDASILEVARKRRKAGDWSRAIGAALSEAGLAPRSGGHWNPNQIRRIVQRMQ